MVGSIWRIVISSVSRSNAPFRRRSRKLLGLTYLWVVPYWWKQDSREFHFSFRLRRCSCPNQLMWGVVKWRWLLHWASPSHTVATGRRCFALAWAPALVGWPRAMPQRQWPRHMPRRQPNNALERPVTRFTWARGQRATHFAPSARLRALRPAAQRER